MSHERAYLNGQFVDASQAVVSVVDGGFLQGTTVAEQLRTFGGKIFRLDAHLQRLRHSLEIVGVDPGLSPDQWTSIASELVAHNHALLGAGDDLGLTLFVTPGIATAPSEPARPTVCMHTHPLRFFQWAEKYERGDALATTPVHQVPELCWPAALKCRSRMHYYLADRQAASRFPGSRALMTDADGHVTEATTANVVLFDERRGLRTPPLDKVLGGISMGVLAELAARLGIAWHHADLPPADVLAADEVLLSSTSPCVLPVVRFNGKDIGSGRPGPIHAQLLAAWSQMVGLDIRAQARRFAAR